MASDCKYQKTNVVVISAHMRPMVTSAAEIMCDLASYMKIKKNVYFITQSCTAFGKESRYGLVYGIYNPFIKSQNLYLRFLAEFLVPYIMAISIGFYLRLSLSSYHVIAYAPTNLQFPLMAVLKKRSSKQFLILRDLFPNWLADIKLIKEQGLTFKLLSALSHFQLKLSDKIGVQANADISKLPQNFQKNCIVLNSFYSDSGKNFLVRAKPDHGFIAIGCFGTFGLAQNWKSAIEVINIAMQAKPNLQMHFYGASNTKLKIEQFNPQIRNRVFINGSVTGAELEENICKIDIGFFSLDQKIKGSNIPGKFVSYCRYGIPTFGICNSDSEVANIIHSNRLGVTSSALDINSAAVRLVFMVDNIKGFSRKHIYEYFKKHHSVSYAYKTMMNSLIS